MNAELIRVIDQSIKEVWVKEIKNDYFSHSILKEDCLKNALYHHLRNRLDAVEAFKDNNIRIYTEFTDNKLKGSGCRADLVIVRLKNDKSEQYLSNDVDTILALIELKFKGERCYPHYIMSDIDKTKMYIKELKIDYCQFYLGFIHESSYSRKEMRWLDNRASLNWAKDKVTELSACRFDDEGEDMNFYVHSYNELNPHLNYPIPCNE